MLVLLIKLSRKHKFLFKGVPLVGGLSIIVSVILVYWLWITPVMFLPKPVTALILASSAMFIFGLIDDLKELSVKTKLIVQALAVLIFVLSGLRTQIVHIGLFANILITFLWMIGITNAFNLLDVVDGLAGGVAVIVAVAFFVISFLNGNIIAAALSAALIGAVGAFVIYNLPPARVYLGNSGSHFLGFFLAGIAILISYAQSGRHPALLTPLLILGFPIFDTVFLACMRIKQKRSVLHKSGDHLVLRFLKIGHSHRKALLLMLSLSLFFAFSGVVISQVSNGLGIAVIVAILVVGVAVGFRMNGVKIDA